MGTFEKANEIDGYLSQLKKAEKNKKRKRLYLIFGAGLLIAAVGIGAYALGSSNSLGGTVADTPDNGNIYDKSMLATLSGEANDTYPDLDDRYLNISPEEGVIPSDAEDGTPILPETDPALVENTPQAGDTPSVANNPNLVTPNNNVPGANNRQPIAMADIPTSYNNNDEFTTKGTVTPANPSAPQNPREADTPNPAKPNVPEEGDKPNADDKVEKPTPPPALPKKPTPTPEKPAKEVMTAPSFPGGQAKMQAFLKQQVKYPRRAKDHGVQGRVNVRVYVKKDGSIANAEVVKGLGYGCDKEVLKAVSKMPKWEPATKNGEAVEKSYILSVAFTLPK